MLDPPCRFKSPDRGIKLPDLVEVFDIDNIHYREPSGAIDCRASAEVVLRVGGPSDDDQGCHDLLAVAEQIGAVGSSLFHRVISLGKASRCDVRSAVKGRGSVGRNIALQPITGPVHPEP
jgi:hypothetical protein